MVESDGWVVGTVIVEGGGLYAGGGFGNGGVSERFGRFGCRAKITL